MVVFTFGKTVRVTSSRIGWAQIIGQASLVFVIFIASARNGSHLVGSRVSGSANLFAYPPGRGCRPKYDFIKDQRCPLALNAFKDLPYCRESHLSSSTPKLPCDVLTGLTAKVESDLDRGRALITTLSCNFVSELQVDLSDKATAAKQIVEVEKKREGSSFECRYMADAERYWVELRHRAWIMNAHHRPDPSTRVVGSDVPVEFVQSDLKGYYTDRQGDRKRLGEESSDMLPHSAAIQPVSSPPMALNALQVVVSQKGRLRKTHGQHVDSRNIMGGSMPSASSMFRLRQSWSRVEQWDRDDFVIMPDRLGDDVQVSALLKMLNISLDRDRNREMPDHSARYCGVSIDIDVEYTNMESWLGLRVTPFWFNDVYYQYHVRGHSWVTCTGRTVFKSASTDGDARDTNGVGGILAFRCR